VESDKGCQLKSVPVFYFIYFEFSGSGFREVCQRTCNIVPGSRSPSPVCTVVPNPNIEKGHICQRNDTQSPEDRIKSAVYGIRRSHWPHGLRRRSAAARLLRSWVRIPRGMNVCCECCVLSVTGFCDELITHPEESYRLWRVVVYDLENLKNEETMTRVGLQRHRKENGIHGHCALL
jgi:hypothetical protein